MSFGGTAIEPVCFVSSQVNHVHSHSAAREFGVGMEKGPFVLLFLHL